MKKLLSWMFVLGVGGVLLVKATIYYRVTAQLDDAIAMVSPFARVTYQGVNSSLSGEVSVEQVMIRAYAVDFPVQIAEISLAFPDLKTLLFIKDDIKNQRLPERMKFSLKHIEIDVEDLKPYLSLTQKDTEQWLQGNGALGCEALEDADAATALQILGYGQLDGSMTLAYGWDKLSKTMTLDMDFSWHDMTRTAMTFEFDEVAALSAVALAQPKLKRIALQLDDLGYNGRFAGYCAEQEAITAKEFIDIHLALARGALQEQGIILGEEWFEAYEYYLHATGPLVISMYPDNMKDLANAHLYKPSDIPRLLGLEISMGDRVIRDISMDWDQEKLMASVAAYQKKDNPTPAVAPEPEPQPEVKIQYREIPLERLNDYLNQRVIALTRDGRKFEGELTRSTEQQILINVAMGSGYATLPIKHYDIESVKVLELPR